MQQKPKLGYIVNASGVTPSLGSGSKNLVPLPYPGEVGGNSAQREHSHEKIGEYGMDWSYGNAADRSGDVNQNGNNYFIPEDDRQGAEQLHQIERYLKNS